MNIYLTDLDDTLFATARKHGDHQRDLVRATTAINERHSFTNTAQRKLLEALLRTGMVIPVTARSTEAFARVHLDFGSRRAVLSNGGVILDEYGVPDPTWRTHVMEISAAASGLLVEMLDFSQRQLSPLARCWIAAEDGVPIYFCLKINDEDTSTVDAGILFARDALQARFDLSDMWLHINGNNLAFTPIGISKHDACRYLLDQLDVQGRDIAVVGIGDSISDIGFMSLCDFMMMPSRSQISDRLLKAQLARPETLKRDV